MKKPEYMMYCLKTPEGALVLMTLGQTKDDVWGIAHGYVCGELGEAWKVKYWKKWGASMRNAARKGYIIVPVEVKEVRGEIHA